MKKRRLLVCMLGLVFTYSAHALSLEECLRLARENYPAIRQYGLIAQTRDFTMENAVKGWLPKVSISAGASVFTDVLKETTVTRQMGIVMKNYVADAAVVVRQNVYDGGQIAVNKQLASAQADVQQRQLDVSLYALNERVEQLYFGILLLDAQLTQNRLLLDDLTNSEQTVRSMMRGGIANQADLDALLVEKVKTTQQHESLETARKAYLRMLGVFVGKFVAEDEPLEKPMAVTASATTNGGVNRPELRFYDSQDLLLDAQRRQLDTRLRPTVSFFGAGWIHSRVSDLLNNATLMGGISLSWNIGALYTRKNDLRKLDVQRQMNGVQRDVFLFNNRLQNEEASGTAQSLRRQIVQDNEIVRLRENIRSKSDKRVQLGTESIHELVRDINAVSQARAQKAQHEIELLKETYRIKNLNNE